MKYPVLLACLIISAQLPGQSNPQMRYSDRVRIHEAMQIKEQFADKIWQGLGEIPMTIVLIADSIEFLINSETRPSGFESIGWDSLIGSTVYFRPRRYEPGLAATFPAVLGNLPL